MKMATYIPYSVRKEQISKAPFIQIAHTYDGDFAGGSTIKYYDGEMTEIGFMLINKKYRQMELAERMTKSRINYARQLGIAMLYAKDRVNNTNSMKKLRKADFRPATELLICIPQLPGSICPYMLCHIMNVSKDYA